MVAGDSTAYAPSMHSTILTIRTNKSSAIIFPSYELTMWTLQTFAWLLFLLETATCSNHSNPPSGVAPVVQRAPALDDTILPVVQRALALSDNLYSVQKALLLSLNYTPTVDQRAFALNDNASYYKLIYHDAYASSITSVGTAMVQFSELLPNNKNVEIMLQSKNHIVRQHDFETDEPGLNKRLRIVRPYDQIETEKSASQLQQNRRDRLQLSPTWTGLV